MKTHNRSYTLSTPPRNDAAVSTLTGVILMVALVVLMTAIVSSFLLGVILPTHKSAYIVADAKVTSENGYPLVTLLNRGGDYCYFSGTGSGYPISVQISSGGRSETALPAPAGLVWEPGSALYITYSGTGYDVTDDPAQINGTPRQFPGNEVTVSVIDTSNSLLVYSKKLTIAGSSGNPAAALTQNVTQTANATVTVTATPTATAVTATRTITVIWSPGGYGYGSLSPPTPLANSQEVRIPRGSSKTIYFVPNANRAVRTIKLDGATVYTGSAIGSTISYTVSNVVEDRTLTATFG